MIHSDLMQAMQGTNMSKHLNKEKYIFQSFFSFLTTILTLHPLHQLGFSDYAS